MSVNMKSDLIAGVTTYMRKKGLVPSAVEGRFMEGPKHDRLLVINFLPSSDTLSNGIKAIEDNVRYIIDFLVRKRYVCDIDWLQIAVNVRNSDCCHVLIKYWCDAAKLRTIGSVLFVFFKSILRRPLCDLVSGSLPHGVPMDGFIEWRYKINSRTANGVEVALYRMGERTARFTLALRETEAIPVAVLRDKVAEMEYEIQCKMNARLYALREMYVGDAEEEQEAFYVVPPNVYVLRFIRTYALPFASGTTTGWLLPWQKIKSFIEVVRNERIRVLEVKEFLFDERGNTWQEGRVVWKTDDMCSPTKGNVAASSQGVQSAMEHDLNSDGHDRACYFLFDCRPLQSSLPGVKSTS